MQTEIVRSYRFALDPTKAQLDVLARHAGAARWAYNHALGMKVAAHKQWKDQVQQLVDEGLPDAEARKRVVVRVPMRPTIQKHLNRIKGDSRVVDAASAIGPERPCPWWHEVSTYCFQSAFGDADQAWKNWLTSLSGARAGRRMGYPKFKKKGRARESFRLHHNVKLPSIRMVGHRRLRLPAIGEVRLHGSGRELARAVERGNAKIQSVTVARDGHRWYAAVLCKTTRDVPTEPNRRQISGGVVGVDLGVKYLATLSQPLNPHDESTRFITNPRHFQVSHRRLAKAQKALARTQKGSNRRAKARNRVARLYYEIAQRRTGSLHLLTKRLVTRFATVAVEDLHVAGMTRSARGTVDAPGRKVQQKAGLNRSLLDASLGELRRQITYKATWYGSGLAVLDRWFPSSKTCSNCGWQNPHLTLADRTFHCGNCECVMDRDYNAARNIAQHAVPIELHVASDTGETVNARGTSVRLAALQGGEREVLKREDVTCKVAPPQRSNPLALPE